MSLRVTIYHNAHSGDKIQEIFAEIVVQMFRRLKSEIGELKIKKDGFFYNNGRNLSLPGITSWYCD